MPKIHPDYQKVVKNVMADAGVMAYRFETGGKHPRVIYTVNGEERFYILPGSPGDTVRGARNAETDLRKHLNAPRRRKKSTAPKSHKKTAAPVRKAPKPIAPVKPDPFEALKHIVVTAKPVETVKMSLWARVKAKVMKWLGR